MFEGACLLPQGVQRAEGEKAAEMPFQETLCGLTPFPCGAIMTLCLRPLRSTHVIKLSEGSNTLGRGPYTTITDERVSREQLSLYVTLSGTVVMVCVGRNPCSYRLHETATANLLQRGEGIELEPVVGACVCFLPNGELEFELGVFEDDDEDNDAVDAPLTDLHTSATAAGADLNQTLTYEPELPLDIDDDSPPPPVPAKRPKVAPPQAIAIKLNGPSPGASWHMEVVGKLVICSCCKIEPSVCFPFAGCSVTVTVTKPGAEAESKARKHDSEAAALEFAKKVRHGLVG